MISRSSSVKMESLRLDHQSAIVAAPAERARLILWRTHFVKADRMIAGLQIRELILAG